MGGRVTYEESYDANHNVIDKIYYTRDCTGELVSFNLNDVEYYYIRNAQNDIIGIFDNSGDKVVSYSYDSWGKLLKIEATPGYENVSEKNPYRYRGYRYDNETGLYYLQSRYYNPEWGRFLNLDSLGGQVGGILSHNVFAYCENNPVTKYDPDGYRAATISLGGIGSPAPKNNLVRGRTRGLASPPRKYYPTQAEVNQAHLIMRNQLTDDARLIGNVGLVLANTNSAAVSGIAADVISKPIERYKTLDFESATYASRYDIYSSGISAGLSAIAGRFTGAGGALAVYLISDAFFQNSSVEEWGISHVKRQCELEFDIYYMQIDIIHGMWGLDP